MFVAVVKDWEKRDFIGMSNALLGVETESLRIFVRLFGESLDGILSVAVFSGRKLCRVDERRGFDSL